MAGGVKREERLHHIQQKLGLHGVVHISDFSKELDTSVVTIRKDLLYLEEQGELVRVAGGAVAHWKKQEEQRSVVGTGVKNLDLKRNVARKAAELFIRSGDTLLVTSGMTPYLAMEYALGCTDLKILTDSLLIAETMCRRPDYQVFLFGGEVNEKDAFVHGRDAVRQASRYMADKVIVTMDGIDPDIGLTALRSEGADTLRAILARGRKRIVLADISKIGKESFCNIGEISYADILVTNRTEDPT